MKELNLQEIRGQLDVIDAQIIELFEKRMQLCADVAEFKIETGKAVFDKEREQQKIAAVTGMAHGEFNKKAAEELFSQIMTISRRLQYQLLEQHGQSLEMGFSQVEKLPSEDIRVVYQGLEGAYSHAATLSYFGDDVNAYHVPMFEDAMKAVQDGEADYAVIPIENSSAGAVIDTYDLMIKYDNTIVAEIMLPINHALLGVPGAGIEDIQTVYSHPQSLMQCSEYLNGNRQWRQISMPNNAVAAKKVIDDQDRTQAAVASVIAGQLYGLQVLKECINHNKNNTTRFVVLCKNRIFREDSKKVSICFELPHHSGTLYNMLGNFIYNGVNMVMIESRPIIGKNWEYRFFVDIEGKLSDASVQNSLKGISEEASYFRILGNY
ncbi:prephenate dehydratase [Clostridium sp. chh4-2]|uniref:prephenate dehydratase n=1 Tax=Clostridium sp. chh4-2 TaxID=2067550 RepID=UPI000CCDE166|nr:prephenate dehydratase [Clostridium sp. chh4-2]PNV61850.1 prephenate dehydratase [Clostridium sp. chh4-2]